MRATIEITPTHLVVSMIVRRSYIWQACGPFRAVNALPGLGMRVIMFDHPDEAGTRRGRRNLERYGASSMIPSAVLRSRADTITAALNAARVADDPVGAAATVIEAHPGPARPRRWRLLIAAALGGAYVVVSADALGPLLIGLVTLVHWLIARANPTSRQQHRVVIEVGRRYFGRRAAPYLLYIAGGIFVFGLVRLALRL